MSCVKQTVFRGINEDLKVFNLADFTKVGDYDASLQILDYEREISFNKDKTRFYLYSTGNGRTKVHQYSCVDGDVYTGVYLGFYDFIANTARHTSCSWNVDGTKYYIGNWQFEQHQYTALIPWDIESLLYDNIKFVDVARNSLFKVIGSKMYVGIGVNLQAYDFVNDDISTAIIDLGNKFTLSANNVFSSIMDNNEYITWYNTSDVVSLGKFENGDLSTCVGKSGRSFNYLDGALTGFTMDSNLKRYYITGRISRLYHQFNLDEGAMPL